MRSRAPSTRAVLLLALALALLGATPASADPPAEFSVESRISAEPPKGHGNPAGEDPGEASESPTTTESLPGFGPVPEGAEAPPSEGGPSKLGEGSSPACKNPGLNESAKSSCERSGSVARPYPLSSYGLDHTVETKFTAPDLIFEKAIQSFVSVLWDVLLKLVNAVLLLLEWTLSIDLVGTAMAEVHVALANFNDNVLGQAWLLAGISIAGLWGIWNGLLRMRTTETLVGLVVTVLMMCGALLIIHEPEATVGEVSRVANEGVDDAMTLASAGRFDDGDQALPEASSELFNMMVVGPWCALQFGDVSKCNERAGGDSTFAEVWLAHPAMSEKRKELARDLAEKDPDHAYLQGAAGTLERAAVALLIGLGMCGGICLFVSLGTRLTFAAVAALGILVAAPVFLIFPAFGETGRKAFLTWLKRLGGFLIAKFVYAVFLAVVILIGSLIVGFDEIQWEEKWLFLTVFWWGAFLRRDELIGFVIPSQQRGGGSLLSNLHSAFWLASSARGAMTALPRRAMRIGTRGAKGVGNRLARRRAARDSALSQDAQNELWRQGAHEVTQRHAADNFAAESLLERAHADRARKQELPNELKSARARIARAKSQREALRRQAKGTTDPHERRELAELMRRADRNVAKAQAQFNDLGVEGKAIDERLSDPRLDWARARSRRYGGRSEATDYEVRDWIARRRAELSGGTPGGFEDERDRRDSALLARARTENLSRAQRRAAARELRVSPERKRQVSELAREARRAAARGARRRGMGRW